MPYRGGNIGKSWTWGSVCVLRVKGDFKKNFLSCTIEILWCGCTVAWEGFFSLLLEKK